MRVLIVLFLSLSYASFVSAEKTHLKRLMNVHISQLGLNLRVGFMLEQQEFKACVIYLQGLGDSILNHDPYFSRLTNAGYRVLLFDYMGQGGSEGSMNDTRVSVAIPRDATEIMKKKYQEKLKFKEIGNQAKIIWNEIGEDLEYNNKTCKESPKLVIGWSTGGLAAYKMAYEEEVDGVVLIAPGISPKIMVGEASDDWLKMLLFQPLITEETLSRNKFVGQENPHLDPVQPKSPMHVPQFAGNLILTSMQSQHWKISKKVQGLAFLSGEDDTYVNKEKTFKTLQKNAPHFNVVSYEKEALHELDNELDHIRFDLYERTLEFFDQIVGQ